jgi:response regulator RpfG family c-di-GMP phosphodiesterase
MKTLPPDANADAEAEDALVWGDDAQEADPATAQRTSAAPSVQPWTVLIVDDDESVHIITRLVLSGLTFRDRPIQLLSAYTAGDGVSVLRAHPEVALVLLDVVMETDDAGLRAVQQVREELNNVNVRVVLRTGQPGKAPERDVVVRYEIDGYELKTEQTSQNLVTVVIAALRSFDLIRSIERNRAGLELIMNATAEMSRLRTARAFAASALQNLQALFNRSAGSVFCAPTSRSTVGESAPMEVLAGTGPYTDWAARMLDDADPEGHIRSEILQPGSGDPPLPDHIALGTAVVLKSPHVRSATIWVHDVYALDPIEQQLLDVFCSKVAVAFDNVQLMELFRKAQQATVVALADLAEYRDTDTGEHVLRVARTTDLLARDLHAGGKFPAELDELLVEQIGLASMLHDVGKVSIPDAVLLKPDRLDDDEQRLMQTHAGVGMRILARADRIVGQRSYLTLAAEIAIGHHEWYDGTGYPHRVAGSKIPLSARITAVADVYDALTHARPYKQAWPADEARLYIIERSGTQFDPEVVQSFLRVLQSPEWNTPFGVPTETASFPS